MKKSNNDINLVIFGSGNRSLSVISKLKELDFNIVMVVTQKNKDLTLEESFPDLKLIFEKNVNNIKFIQHLKGLSIDYFILSGFRQILKEEVLAIPSKATINLHAGKLPEYRGGSPLNWQIINGENYAYIYTILTDKGIDTGNILVENQIKILDIFHCPHGPKSNCICRKPKAGMLIDAQNKYSIDMKKSWMIGDSERDIEAAVNAKLTNTILFNELQSPIESQASYIVNSLEKIKNIITN